MTSSVDFAIVLSNRRALRTSPSSPSAARNPFRSAVAGPEDLARRGLGRSSRRHVLATRTRRPEQPVLEHTGSESAGLRLGAGRPGSLDDARDGREEALLRPERLEERTDESLLR